MNDKVEMIKSSYPAGTRIRLIRMDDSQAPPSGTEGTVILVDDIGQIQMKWDNGSSLALNYDLDTFERV